MKRAFVILLVLFTALAVGCTYKFSPGELEHIEFYESTNITDWDNNVLEKKHIITISSENTGLAERITEIVNNNSLQQGVYKRNESCITEYRDPGLVILKYKVGIITIEQDFCENNSQFNIIYNNIESAIETFK